MTDSVLVVDVEYTVVLRVVDAACCEVTYNTAVTVLATVLNPIPGSWAVSETAVMIKRKITAKSWFPKRSCSATP